MRYDPPEAVSWRILKTIKAGAFVGTYIEFPFDSEALAGKVALRLRRQGFDVEVRPWARIFALRLGPGRPQWSWPKETT